MKRTRVSLPISAPRYLSCSRRFRTRRFWTVGCGDGVLTRKLSMQAVTSSALIPVPTCVQPLGGFGLPRLFEMTHATSYSKEVDAVFSNAALHWMKDADQVRQKHRPRTAPPRAVRRRDGWLQMRGDIHNALVEELNCHRLQRGNRPVRGISPLRRSSAPIFRRRASTSRTSN